MGWLDRLTYVTSTSTAFMSLTHTKKYQVLPIFARPSLTFLEGERWAGLIDQGPTHLDRLSVKLMMVVLAWCVTVDQKISLL